MWLVSCGKSVSSLVFLTLSTLSRPTECPAECVRFLDDELSFFWLKAERWQKIEFFKEKVANSDSGSRNGKMGSSSAVAVQLGSRIAHCHLELEGWDWRGRVVTSNFGLMSCNCQLCMIAKDCLVQGEKAGRIS